MAELSSENRAKSVSIKLGDSYELTIEFDQETQLLTLHTPEKNRIEISDKAKSIKLTDQNKNELVMDKRGIILSSAKDLKLSAKGEISLKAAQVTATASLHFAATAGASTTLSASGQTIIKGAIVLIN